MSKVSLPRDNWKRYFSGRTIETIALGHREAFALDLKSRGLMGTSTSTPTFPIPRVMMAADTGRRILGGDSVGLVMVWGVEAHGCVLKTVLDLGQDRAYLLVGTRVLFGVPLPGETPAETPAKSLPRGQVRAFSLWNPRGLRRFLESSQNTLEVVAEATGQDVRWRFQLFGSARDFVADWTARWEVPASPPPV